MSAMKRSRSALLGAILAANGATCLAGPFSDDVAKCFSESVSQRDRALISRWFILGVASHPDATSDIFVRPEARRDMNAGLAKLFARLIARDCRSEVLAGLEHEGEASLKSGFFLLGASAIEQVTQHPQVTSSLKEFADSIDAREVASALATKPD